MSDAKTPVKVEFPFRGLFHWKRDDARASIAFSKGKAINEALSWQEVHAVTSALDKRLLMSDSRPYTFDETFKEVSRHFTSSLTPMFQLSVQQRLAVMDGLVIPASRNVDGDVPWSAQHPWSEDEFVVDPYTVKNIHHPSDWSFEQSVASVVKNNRGAQVFRITIGEDTVVVRHANDILKGRTTSVDVFFPFIALFQLDGDAEARIKLYSRGRWDASREKNVLHQLKSTMFKNPGVQVPDYGTVYWAVRNLNLSLQDTSAVVDALVVPATRGKMGNYTYLDPQNPAAGVIADPSLTKRYDVPYREDGNYMLSLRETVDASYPYFWYQVVN